MEAVNGFVFTSLLGASYPFDAELIASLSCVAKTNFCFSQLLYAGRDSVACLRISCCLVHYFAPAFIERLISLNARCIFLKGGMFVLNLL